MIELLEEIWSILRDDATLQAFWAGADDPGVRVHFEFAPRGQKPPYITYAVRTGGEAEWPMRKSQLAFSVYDYRTHALRALEIINRVTAVLGMRGYLVDPDQAVACRSYAFSEPYGVPTGSEEVYRLDTAAPLRWFDSSGVQTKLNRYIP